MDLGIAGRRAAVAGASAGLGLASAAALVAEGARVAMCSRSREHITAAADAIGDSAVPIVADLASPEGADGFIADAADALGAAPEILVANAGGPPPGTFGTTSINEYRTAFDLTTLSTIAMCRAAVPSMQDAGWGRVVAITSFAVREPRAALIASTTARTAVTAFLAILAREVAVSGVTVNAVQPGLHDTARLRELVGANMEPLRAEVPVGELGDPADFGSVVAFMCSEHARYITGTNLNVDGGEHKGLL